jgi:hypothetical protein
MTGFAVLSVALSPGYAAASSLQEGQAVDLSFVAIFFVFIALAIAASIAWSRSMRGSVQRPMTEATSFPPPPPPDTVMVKCEYCGAEQTWRETCVQCGAPMPKPKIG